MAKHTEIKPHVCDLCGKSFALVYQLRSHLLNHEGTFKFHCEHCDYKTNVKGDFEGQFLFTPYFMQILVFSLVEI